MVTIREARLPNDKPVLLGFIDGLQRYEAALESNRRLDSGVAEEYFTELARDAANGKMYVAEIEQKPVGWAVVHGQDGPVFVTADERRHAYIAELFVDEAVRAQGIGRALIGACEQWARDQGFATVQIGYIAGNLRAGRVYTAAGYAPYATQLRKRL